MFDIRVRADLVCEYAIRVDRVLLNAMLIRCQRRNCFGNALRSRRGDRSTYARPKASRNSSLACSRICFCL